LTLVCACKLGELVAWLMVDKRELELTPGK
jgi:hypothetical protein